MGLLFYSDTVIFRKYKPPLSCSVLQSDNYMIIGACVRNITDGVTLAYSERINSADPVNNPATQQLRDFNMMWFCLL